MTDGVFQRDGPYAAYKTYAFARATEEMSTQSETDFEWSVKLHDSRISIGIASQLQRVEGDWIEEYDDNAIMLSMDADPTCITEGSCDIHSNVKPRPRPGDVIRFSFQPQPPPRTLL